MSSVNKVTILGNLGADPETRTFGNGGRAVSFRVACTEKWTDKQSGERKEKTEWVPVVIYNEGLGKIAEQYLRKGSKVYLEGKFVTRKWQDQSGTDRFSTEVVLQNFGGELVLLGEGGGGNGGGRGDGDSGGGGGGYQARQPRGGGNARSGGGAPRRSNDVLDDDIPFEMEWRG